MLNNPFFLKIILAINSSLFCLCYTFALYDLLAIPAASYAAISLSLDLNSNSIDN